MSERVRRDLGGYIVPKIIWVERPGLKARIWRSLARWYPRRSWWERGRMEIDTFDFLKVRFPNVRAR